MRWWQAAALILVCSAVSVSRCGQAAGSEQLRLAAGVITSSQPELTVSHNPSSLVPIPGRHSLWSEELESGGPFQNCNGSLREGEQAGNGELSPGPSEPDSKSRSHKSLEWLFSLELGHVILESLVTTCRTWVTCH